MKQDWRELTQGREIPSRSYCDQPYVVVTADGTWLCVMTTGAGEEGDAGQHIVAIRSADQGQTWSEPVAIEPPSGPEAGWAMPLIVPDGRIYVFYTYNTENLRTIPNVDGSAQKRVDSIGDFCYRYSDDGGKSWSLKRYRIPMRAFEIDRANSTGGRVLFHWGVGKPFLHQGKAYIGYSKVGGFGRGFFVTTEGAMLCSPNLQGEADPDKHIWQTLPDGEAGLRSPAGPICEEYNATPMNDGSLYAICRTIEGHPVHFYSRDGGHTWSATEYMRYAPGGRLVKHPRAANFVRRLNNGKYIYWFHNHGGRPLREMEDICDIGYAGRNPVWLCGGVERDGFIHWSQPEIILYDHDPAIRISYPDFIEQDGKLFITETQKTIARSHEIPMDLIEAMWQRAAGNAAIGPKPTGLVAQCAEKAAGLTLPVLDDSADLTIVLRLELQTLRPWDAVYDARDGQGNGVVIRYTDCGCLRLELCGITRGQHNPTGNRSGAAGQFWDSDPLPQACAACEAAFIIDRRACVILPLLDGVLCDGGDVRQYGWGRLLAETGALNGARMATLGAGVQAASVYARALRVNEIPAALR